MGFDGTVNSIMAMRTKGTPEPESGMGVTVLYPGDRYPGTIAEVVRYKSGQKKGEVKEFTMWWDDFEVSSGSAADGSAKYKITPTPAGTTDRKKTTVSRTVKGWRIGDAKGTPVAVGYRDAYQDPHF